MLREGFLKSKMSDRGRLEAPGVVVMASRKATWEGRQEQRTGNARVTVDTHNAAPAPAQRNALLASPDQQGSKHMLGERWQQWRMQVLAPGDISQGCLPSASQSADGDVV